MLKQQRLRRSIGSMMVGQFFNYLIMLVQIPYLTRHLSPGGFGVYSFANTLMMVGMTFLTYAANNQSTFLFRKYAASINRRSMVFWNQFSLQLILAAIVVTTIAACLALSTQLRQDFPVYLILVANFVFLALYSPWVLAAVEKFRTISTLITGARLATLILLVLTVHSPADTAWAFAAVVIPNAIIALGFFAWIMSSGAVRPVTPRKWRPLKVLKRDFFVALNIYAATAFSYVAIIIAKFLIDAHEYGHLAFADRFRWIAQVIIPTFGAVLFSRYCGERAISLTRGAEFGRKSALVLGAFGIAIGAGLAILLKPAIMILGGREFIPATMPLLIVAATIPLIAVNYYLTFFVVNVFDMGKQQVAAFAITSAAVVLALMLKRPSTPAYIMAVIGTGELVRAIVTWGIIHASGMHVFRPGIRR